MLKVFFKRPIVDSITIRLFYGYCVGSIVLSRPHDGVCQQCRVRQVSGQR